MFIRWLSILTFTTTVCCIQANNVPATVQSPNSVSPSENSAVLREDRPHSLPSIEEGTTDAILPDIIPDKVQIINN